MLAINPDDVSADDGKPQRVTAQAAIVPGVVICFDQTSRGVVLATARITSHVKSVVGMSCSAAQPGEQVDFVPTGHVIRLGAILTPGRLYVLGDTPGSLYDLDEVPGGCHLTAVGFSVSTDQLFVHPIAVPFLTPNNAA